MKYIKLITLSVIILLFTACSTKPTHLELTIKSNKNINLDDEGISSPLMIYFYELDNVEKFSKLDFRSITQNDNEKIKEDIITKNKHIIVQNQEQTYKILFDQKAKYLGLIMSFKKIDNDNKWKHIIKLEKDSYNEENLIIDAYDIKKED